MAKLLVERRRLGSAVPKKGRWKEHWRSDPEAVPSRLKVSMKRWGSKMFNENLRPLKRFLHSNVGRPWDKVYSEIAEYVRPSSTVQRHILEHLFGMVYVDVEEREGHLYPKVSSRFWGGLRLGRLYVCPRTGLLREVRACKRQCCRLLTDRVWLDSGDVARRLDGKWRVVELRPIPNRIEHPKAFDVVLRKRLFNVPGESPSRHELAQEHGKEGVYACSLRKLSRYERQRLGLPRKDV